MTKLTLVENIITDANNRYEAINPTEWKDHWFDWKSQARPEDKPMVEQISWKTKQDAFDILIPYLEDKYKSIDFNLSKKKQIAEKFLEQNKDVLFWRIAELTKHPIEYNEIQLFITTYARCPYNREKWYIRLSINTTPERMLSIVAHEILHFQFHKYYSNNPKVKILNQDQYYLLKESLTFLLNIEFKNIITQKDFWYPKHKELRKKLEEYRVSQPADQRDFEKLIEYWCDILLNMKNEK